MTEVSYYNTFALVSLIVFILLVVLDIVIWFKLDIRHYLAVLTGSEAKKTIDRIKQDAESGAVQADRRRRNGKAVISWNTSEGLEGKKTYQRPLSMDSEQTVLLGQSAAPAQGMSQMQGTTLLQGSASMQADPYATMVLSVIDQQSRDQQPQQIPVSDRAADESEEPRLYKPVSMPGFVVEKEIVNTAGNEKT